MCCRIDAHGFVSRRSTIQLVSGRPGRSEYELLLPGHRVSTDTVKGARSNFICIIFLQIQTSPISYYGERGVLRYKGTGAALALLWPDSALPLCDYGSKRLH